MFVFFLGGMSDPDLNTLWITKHWHLFNGWPSDFAVVHQLKFAPSVVGK